MKMTRILCLALCLCMVACIFGGCAAANGGETDDASTEKPAQENSEEIDAIVSDPVQSEPPSAADLRGEKRVITGKDIGYYHNTAWLEDQVMPHHNILFCNVPTSVAIQTYGEDVLYRVTFTVGGVYVDCDLNEDETNWDEMISERYAYLDSLGIPFQEVERYPKAAVCMADLSHEEIVKLGSYGWINCFKLFLDENPMGNCEIRSDLTEEMEAAGEDELLRVQINWDYHFFDELADAAISSSGELTEEEEYAIRRNVFYHALDGQPFGEGTLGELFAARETVVNNYEYYTQLTVSEIHELMKTEPARVLSPWYSGDENGNLNYVAEVNDGNRSVLYADRFRVTEDIPEEWLFLSE